MSDERDEPRVTVVGQQMADARAQEVHHRRMWAGSGSPLAGVHYNHDAGEADLLRLLPSPVDARLAQFFDELGAAGATPPEEVRGALTTEDFYTLVTHARRAVVRSLRSEGGTTLKQATVLLGLIDPSRLDHRDLSWAAALCSWGLRRAGIDPVEVLQSAAAIGNPTALAVLGRMLHMDIDLAEWGFVQVKVSEGPGLAQWDYARFEPTVDLVPAALRVADALAEDCYLPTSITVGAELPAFWFGGAKNPHVDGVLTRVRATVSLSSAPRQELDPTRTYQMLLGFVSECESREDADTLLAEGRRASGSRFHTVGVRQGRILAILFARSVRAGVDSWETNSKLARFEGALAAIVGGLATR